MYLEQKGGALVSTMHNYTIHGDPFIKKYIKSMLQEVSKPFYEMLQRWIYEGELDDPYREFFVACDPTVPEDELWQSKYSIHEDMIPSFISGELAQKVTIAPNAALACFIDNPIDLFDRQIFELYAIQLSRRHIWSSISSR